jgi:hypothetical protein
MISEEKAQYLLQLSKHIQINNKLIDKHQIVLHYPIDVKLFLQSKEESEYEFVVAIIESEKRALKLSLHCLEKSNSIGLLRIDFQGRHQNPFEIKRNVPVKFHKYAGQFLDDYGGHIHFVIDGYKPLAWALPLEEDEFPCKEITNDDEYSDIIKAFFNRISVKTECIISKQHNI